MSLSRQEKKKLRDIALIAPPTFLVGGSLTELYKIMILKFIPELQGAVGQPIVQGIVGLTLLYLIYNYVIN